MAIITFGQSGSRPYGVLTVNEISTTTSNNTSSLSISLVLRRPSPVSSNATKTASCTINGVTYNWNGIIGGSGNKTLISATQTVLHNDDGSKKISVSASVSLNITWGGQYVGTISGDGTIVLSNIPRYAIVNQSLVNKTETSLNINWFSDNIVNYIWYSTNDGASWSGFDVPEASSGNYTIDGLVPDTNYMVRTRVRRQDNQLSSTSEALNIRTYAYPYGFWMPNFTIGEKLSIGLYNPLKHNITVVFLGDDNTRISENTTSDTAISGYDSEIVQNKLYASIPNAKSGSYKVRVNYDGNVTTKTGGTYTVNANQCLPIIGSVSYKDANPTSSAITGNDQDIVRNQSIVQYTANGLSAQKSATISSCSVLVNGINHSLVVSGNKAIGGIATIDSAVNVPAVFTVTDSRGLTTTQTININMLDWVSPSAIIDIHRQNNFYSEVDALVRANFSSINGNNRVSITYKAKKTTDSQYTIEGTFENNVQSTFSADNKYEWDMQIIISDRFSGTVTYNLKLPKGVPIIYFDRLLSSTGFNCFPKEEKSVEVNGVNIKRAAMTNSLSQSITNLVSGAFTAISLNFAVSTDDNRLTSSNGGIKIGANISQVLVSGQIYLGTVSTAEYRYLGIFKNNCTSLNLIAQAGCRVYAGESKSITVSPALTNIHENDVILLAYLTNRSDDEIIGSFGGGQTFLTIDVVN